MLDINNLNYYTDFNYTDFDTFISSIKHRLKSLGDIGFIERFKNEPDIKDKHKILYIVAMIDYICNLYNLDKPYWVLKYSNERMDKILLPEGALIFYNITGLDTLIVDCYKDAIKEFLKYNIVEVNVRDVI